MRIVFVGHHGSIHVRRWAAFFVERGHDVHVVTCGDGDVPREAAYEVHDVGAPRPAKAGYLLRVPSVRRLVRRLRPDVVHAHYATSYGLLALASGVRPLVVTAHGSDVLLGRRHVVYRRVLRRVLGAAAVITVPSAEMRDAVLELTGPGIELETFQYGVETERLAGLAARVRAGAEPGRRRIVSARPLRPLYRTDVLVDALALLRDRDDWECLVFGDGPDRPATSARLVELGLDERVSLVGQRPVAEVEEALAGADLYASFAESDGASIALLEAMALGAIPVVSDIPANRAWVREGDNGALAPIDPEGAAAALVRALALDRATVAAANRVLVSERADRDRNLGRLEQRLVALVAAGQRDA